MGKCLFLQWQLCVMCKNNNTNKKWWKYGRTTRFSFSHGPTDLYQHVISELRWHPFVPVSQMTKKKTNIEYKKKEKKYREKKILSQHFSISYSHFKLTSNSKISTLVCSLRCVWFECHFFPPHARFLPYYICSFHFNWSMDYCKINVLVVNEAKNGNKRHESNGSVKSHKK